MLKEQYPYVDEEGVEHADLIRHWTDDETKTLLQIETGFYYTEAIDIYPCPYTYEEVDIPEPEPEPDPDDPVEDRYGSEE